MPFVNLFVLLYIMANKYFQYKAVCAIVHVAEKSVPAYRPNYCKRSINLKRYKECQYTHRNDELGSEP